MHHPTDRIVHTMAFGTPVIEPETLNAQAVVEQRGGEGGGQQFCSQMYFYDTNRGAHIYLAPWRQYPLLHHCSEV